MFQQIRRLLKHSAVYGMGHVLTRMVSFILLPYLTHVLTPEEYGAVALLYTFIAIALVLYTYGFDITFLRYYILESDEAKKRDIFCTIFWVALLSSTVFSILIAATTGFLASLVFENPESIGISTQYLILVSVCLLFVETLVLYPFLYLRAVEKSLPFIAIKTAGVALNIGLAIVLISVFDRGVAGVFEANLVATAFQLIFLLPIILKNVRFKIQFDQLREFFRFGMPNVPSQVFVMVIELANRKIIEIILGLSIVGIFSAGYKLGLFMAVITMGFRFAWQPFFLSIADKPGAKETFSRVLTYYFLVTGAIFLCLVFSIKPLMTMNLPVVGTLIDPEYWEGLQVFPIILLAHMCNGAYANFMVGVYLKKKTGLMPIVTGVAAAVNIIGNIIFIPIFGMMAAAWMTLISYFILAALLYVLIQKHYPIEYEWKRIGLLFACGSVIYLISKISILEAFWLAKFALIPALFVMLKFVGFFMPDEIAAVKRKLFNQKVTEN